MLFDVTGFQLNRPWEELNANFLILSRKFPIVFALKRQQSPFQSGLFPIKPFNSPEMSSSRQRFGGSEFAVSLPQGFALVFSLFPEKFDDG